MLTYISLVLYEDKKLLFLKFVKILSISVKNMFCWLETVARLLTGVLDASGLKDGCLTFFYNMAGIEISLNVYLVEEKNQTLIFTQSNVDNAWIYGQARVTPTEQFQVQYQLLIYII